MKLALKILCLLNLLLFTCFSTQAMLVGEYATTGIEQEPVQSTLQERVIRTAKSLFDIIAEVIPTREQMGAASRAVQDSARRMYDHFRGQNPEAQNAWTNTADQAAEQV